MRRAQCALVAAWGLVLLELPDGPALAAWSADPGMNLPVCTFTASQNEVRGTTDGAGGAIFAWRDERAGASSTDIYAQRVDAAGNVLWDPAGVPVDTEASVQLHVQIASDAAGGAFIMWQDSGTSPDRVRLARIDGGGSLVWPTLTLSVEASDAQVVAHRKQLVEDGAGGVIAVWGHVNGHVYAHRVDSGGNTLWSGLVANAATSNTNVTVDADGTGGALLCWVDRRVVSNINIYAQKIASGGAHLWTAGGDSVTGAAGTQNFPVIAHDGSGGAIIAWNDARGDCQLYAQHMDAGGSRLWTGGGMLVGFIASICGNEPPKIGPDGSGGAIVIWESYLGGAQEWDVLAQRLDASGSFLWGGAPVAVCSATRSQNFSELLVDGGGGALVAWADARSVSRLDIFAQRLDATGAPQWQADGDTVEWGAPSSHPDLVPVSPGQAIIGYERGLYPGLDIYAQLFPVDEVVAVEDRAPDVGLGLTVSPNPSSREVQLRLDLPRPSRVTISIYDVRGRRVRDLGDRWLSPGTHLTRWDGLGTDGRRAPAGIYFARLAAGRELRVAPVVVLGP